MNINFNSIFRKKSFILFFASFLLMLFYVKGIGHVDFLGDANEVWELSSKYWSSDRPTSYVEYRGPFTFIFYGVMHSIASAMSLDPINILLIVNSIIFSLLTTVFFPTIFSFIYERAINCVEVAFFVVVTFIFFKGYFLYPMTDFPAFFFFLFSIFCLIKISPSSALLWIFTSAIFFAASVMMRSSYIVAIIFLILFMWRACRNNTYSAKNTALMISFFLLISLACIFSNQGSTESSHSLLTKQLHGGLKYQKVEWNAGDSGYPGQMWIRERRGEEILKNEGLDKITVFSVRQYIYLLSKYPADILLINIRHFFSGIDLIYDSVFIYNFHKSRIFSSIVNYSLIFLALCIITNKISTWKKSIRGELSILAAMSIQSMIAIPFVIEVRFFMPLILTLMAVSIFSRNEGISVIRRPGFILHWALFVIMSFLLSMSIFESAIPNKIIMIDGQ